MLVARTDGVVGKLFLNSNSLVFVDTNVADWNSVKRVGMYSGNKALNSPPEAGKNTWVNAIVLAANGNGRFLYMVGFYNHSMSVKLMSDNVWGEWVSVIK